MTDSADSMMNNEVTEDDIKKLTQQIPGVVATQDVLNAIGSESEQQKLSTTKLSNQLAPGAFVIKQSIQGSSDVLDGRIDKRLSATGERVEKRLSATGERVDKRLSATGEREPALPKRLPATGEREPALPKRLSATGEREPALSKRLSATGEREPALSKRLSAMGERESALSKRLSATGEREPALPKRLSATGETEPAVTKRLSAMGEKEPALPKRLSATGETEPAVTKRLSATGETEPAVTKRLSATGETEPAVTKRLSAMGEREPALSKHNSATENNEPDLSSKRSKSDDTTLDKHNDDKPISTRTSEANEPVEKLSEDKSVEDQSEERKRAVDIVPENMFSVLQQRAQNVLKMISEKKYPEGIALNTEGHLHEIVSSNHQSQESSHQSIVKKSNESANLKSSKTSQQSSDTLSDVKSSPKPNENPTNEKSSFTISKPEEVTRNLSYTTMQPGGAIQLLKENISVPPENKGLAVLNSESQQSNRSTEQCTTDYCVKNSGQEVAGEQIEVTGSVSDCTAKGNRLVEQCTTVPESKPQTPNEAPIEVSESSKDTIKKLSQIIYSNELPIQLTKKGELISHLFKQKILTKLESNDNLDEKSIEVANLTAVKFAKWMEDILKDIDLRRQQSAQVNPKSTDLKEIKEEREHEDEFVSAPSSKESLADNEDLGLTDKGERPEVIKIQEISETELIDKYGPQLLKESGYELFHFVGPDNVPVEVRHLTSVESKKVMVVKKKTTDTQWSNWVIEVGPEVTLDSVSGDVSQKVEKEDNESNVKWNLTKFGWEQWKPNMFQSKVTYCKIPILKKQCVMTEADFEIEYPTYPACIGPHLGKNYLDGAFTHSPQAD